MSIGCPPFLQCFAARQVREKKRNKVFFIIRKVILRSKNIGLRAMVFIASNNAIMQA